MELNQVYQAILENVNEEVYVRDLDMNIIYINPASEKLTGWSLDEALGKKCYDVFGDEKLTCKEVCPVEKAISQKLHILHREDKLKTRSGDLRKVQISISPLYEAETVTGAVVVMEDITHLREVEQTSATTLIALEKEMEERKRTEETLLDSERRLRTQNRIANIFLTKHGDEMYGAVLDVVLEAMHSKYGVFGYINKEGALVCPSMTKDIWNQCQMSDKDIIFPEAAWGDSIWGNGLRTKRPAYSNTPFQVPKDHIQIDRCLTVPLVFQDKPIGLFTVANKPTDYTESDKQSLELIAEYVAPVLHARLERKKSEAALRESEAQKRAILDASIDKIRYVDKDMRIIWANKTTATDLDMCPDDLIGRVCYEIFHGRDTPCQGCPTVRAMETGQIERAVMHKFKTNGIETEIYWDNYSVPLKNEVGYIEGFIQITRDITDQKQAMDALRKSEETMKAINASSPVGITLVRKRILDWANKAMYHMLGYEEGSLLGESVRVLYPDDEEYNRVGHVLYPGIKKTGMNQVETRLVKKDGSIIHCYIQICALNPSDPDKGVIVAVMDITDRKLAEEHIHTLTQQLMKAQENERQMISRELHDRVGQDLSTLKIGLDTLIDNQPGVLPETRQRVWELSKMLQGSIMAIRDISYDLRPPSLDQLGLVQTLLQYCKDFSEKTGLSVDFTSAGMEHLRLDFDTEINLYRLIQEGLNNIKKHAYANRVTIRLISSFPKIILRIEDDGKGFDLEKRLITAQNEKRMGLRSMKERVSLLNGAMRIQSHPGKGTKILIEVPYEEKKSEL